MQTHFDFIKILLMSVHLTEIFLIVPLYSFNKIFVSLYFGVMMTICNSLCQIFFCFKTAFIISSLNLISTIWAAGVKPFSLCHTITFYVLIVRLFLSTLKMYILDIFFLIYTYYLFMLTFKSPFVIVTHAS